MHIKLKKINILILIHYFQSPNFIDSVLNKTQNTKKREGLEIFKRDSRWDEKPMIKQIWSSSMALRRRSSTSWRQRSAPTLSLEWWQWWRPCCWCHFRCTATVTTRREGGVGRAASGGNEGRLAWKGVWSGSCGCLNVRGESVRVKSVGYVG